MTIDKGTDTPSPVAEIVERLTVEAANITRELAYAAAKFVATDDEYWRRQMDYLEKELATSLARAVSEGTPT